MNNNKKEMTMLLLFLCLSFVMSMGCGSEESMPDPSENTKEIEWVDEDNAVEGYGPYGGGGVSQQYGPYGSGGGGVLPSTGSAWQDTAMGLAPAAEQTEPLTQAFPEVGGGWRYSCKDPVYSYGILVALCWNGVDYVQSSKNVAGECSFLSLENDGNGTLVCS